MNQYALFFKISFGLIAFVTLQSSGCRKESDNDSEPFVVGGMGPADGYIVYDKGYYSDGWRYLEAAPYDQAQYVRWGCDGIAYPNLSPLLGTGKQNTANLVSAQSTSVCNPSSTGAKVCDNLTLNGYSDWFLPSKDEARIMWESLKANGHYTSNMDYHQYLTSSCRSATDLDSAYVVQPAYINLDAVSVVHRAKPWYEVRAMRSF